MPRYSVTWASTETDRDLLLPVETAVHNKYLPAETVCAINSFRQDFLRDSASCRQSRQEVETRKQSRQEVETRKQFRQEAIFRGR